MGRMSSVPTVDCEECGTELDARYELRHIHRHKCRKEDIQWDDMPDWSRNSEFIAWYGTCEVCGRRMYECYVPESVLYDAHSDDRI